MTTNVYDSVAGMLTSDSRWSISKGDWVAYVEDTAYDKLIYTSKVAFLFAGSMPIIDAWKCYVASGMKKGTRPTLVPGTKISVIQVDMADGKIVFHSNNLLKSSFGASIRAMFGGTGASPAKICWDVNKCATAAIASAAKGDHLSGGTVIFLNRIKRNSNAQNTATAAQARQILNDRGILMNIATQQTPILLKDAANDPANPEAQAIAKDIICGDSPLVAPFPGMDEDWSDEKIAEFEAALSMYEED
jgi:hypothetical protein